MKTAELFLAFEHCAQTEKSPHKLANALAKRHDEDATNYVTTTKIGGLSVATVPRPRLPFNLRFLGFRPFF
jgi:hypothetical protein